MTHFYQKNVIVCSGELVHIRSANQEDVGLFYDYIRVILNDGNGMILDGDELFTDINETKNWLSQFLRKPNQLLLLVFCNDQLIANLDFIVSGRKRLSHTGSVALAVHPQYRNRGIGSELMNCFFQWLKSRANIEKVSLHVKADNRFAIQLYQKFGFKEEGRFRKAIKYDDGTYVDDLVMSCWVNHSTEIPSDTTNEVSMSMKNWDIDS